MSVKSGDRDEWNSSLPLADFSSSEGKEKSSPGEVVPMLIGGERAGEEAAVCSSGKSTGLKGGRLTAGDKDLDEQGVSLTVWISALNPASVDLCSFLCSVLLCGVPKISSLSLSLSITLLRFILCSAVDE